MAAHQSPKSYIRAMLERLEDEASRSRTRTRYRRQSFSTTSVDALMGPGARAGEVSRILELDFATLDDALAALHDDAFQEVKSITESLGTRLFLYELSDL